MRLIKGRLFYKEPWYGIWRGMMDRCYREKAGNYRYYGGRGIKVCEEWHNIENFEKWVFASGYSVGMTLDRKNTYGDYSPENCRWADMKTQCNNRRNTVMVEHRGEKHTISEWSEITGINRSTLKNRYCRGERGAALLRPVEIPNGKTWVKKDGKREWVECG